MSTSREVPGFTPLPRVPALLRKVVARPVPSYQTLWRLATDGKIPATEIGGRLYVSDADLREITAQLFSVAA